MQRSGFAFQMGEVGTCGQVAGRHGTPFQRIARRPRVGAERESVVGAAVRLRWTGSISADGCALVRAARVCRGARPGNAGPRVRGVRPVRLPGASACGRLHLPESDAAGLLAGVDGTDDGAGGEVDDIELAGRCADALAGDEGVARVGADGDAMGDGG